MTIEELTQAEQEPALTQELSQDSSILLGKSKSSYFGVKGGSGKDADMASLKYKSSDSSLDNRESKTKRKFTPLVESDSNNSSGNSSIPSPTNEAASPFATSFPSLDSSSSIDSSSSASSKNLFEINDPNSNSSLKNMTHEEIFKYTFGDIPTRLPHNKNDQGKSRSKDKTSPSLSSSSVSPFTTGNKHVHQSSEVDSISQNGQSSEEDSIRQGNQSSEENSISPFTNEIYKGSESSASSVSSEDDSKGNMVTSDCDTGGDADTEVTPENSTGNLKKREKIKVEEVSKSKSNDLEDNNSSTDLRSKGSVPALNEKVNMKGEKVPKGEFKETTEENGIITEEDEEETFEDAHEGFIPEQNTKDQPRIDNEFNYLPEEFIQDAHPVYAPPQLFTFYKPGGVSFVPPFSLDRTNLRLVSNSTLRKIPPWDAQNGPRTSNDNQRAEAAWTHPTDPPTAKLMGEPTASFELSIDGKLNGLTESVENLAQLKIDGESANGGKATFTPSLTDDKLSQVKQAAMPTNVKRALDGVENTAQPRPDGSTGLTSKNPIGQTGANSAQPLFQGLSSSNGSSTGVSSASSTGLSSASSTGLSSASTVSSASTKPSSAASAKTFSTTNPSSTPSQPQQVKFFLLAQPLFYPPPSLSTASPQAAAPISSSKSTTRTSSTKPLQNPSGKAHANSFNATKNATNRQVYNGDIGNPIHFHESNLQSPSNVSNETSHHKEELRVIEEYYPELWVQKPISYNGINRVLHRTFLMIRDLDDFDLPNQILNLQNTLIRSGFDYETWGNAAKSFVCSKIFKRLQFQRSISWQEFLTSIFECYPHRQIRAYRICKVQSFAPSGYENVHSFLNQYEEICDFTNNNDTFICQTIFFRLIAIFEPNFTNFSDALQKFIKEEKIDRKSIHNFFRLLKQSFSPMDRFPVSIRTM